MATISLFGAASTPTDDDATGNAGPGVTWTPPASMVAGDCVFALVQVRQTGLGWAEIDFTNTGGQEWHELSDETFQSTTCSCRAYLCRFNGTWSADPAWDGVVTTSVSGVAVVLHSSDSAYQFDLDGLAGMFKWANFAAPTTPFTVTRTGITTETDGAVVIAGCVSIDDDTYTLITGSWATALPAAQCRNNAGTDQSCAIAYRVFPTAGATGNIEWTQGDVAGDAGITFILALKLVATAAFTSPSQPTVDVLVDGETGTDGGVLTATNLTDATHGSGGSWATNGGTPNNTFVEADGEMALSSARSVKVGSTTYADASATRGYQYDHTQGTELPTWNFTFSESHAIVSMGFWFKTTHALEALDSFSSMALFADGSGAFTVWNFVAQFAGQHVARLECNSNVPSAPHFDNATAYWLTLIMDTTAGVGRLSMWKPSGDGWVQFGFTVSAALATGSPVNRLEVFCTGGAHEAHTGNSYYDDLVLDWTTHAFPLLPGLYLAPSAALTGTATASITEADIV